jgi:hypothetical protein
MRMGQYRTLKSSIDPTIFKNSTTTRLTRCITFSSYTPLARPRRFHHFTRNTTARLLTVEKLLYIAFFMYIGSWVVLALATFAFARPTESERVLQVYRRDTQDAQDTASLRKALAAITAAVTAFDGSLKQITPDNVAISIKDLNTKGHGLADALSNAAKMISGSPPLKGIQDAIGLLTPGKAIGNALNSTYQSFMAKADIIKNSKQTALVVDMLKAQKQPLVDFEKAFLTQLPASMASVIPKDLIPADEMLLALLDVGIQQIADVMDGKSAGFGLPGGLPASALPSGFPAGALPVAGGVPAAPVSIATTVASAPAVATKTSSPSV